MRFWNDKFSAGLEWVDGQKAVGKMRNSQYFGRTQASSEGTLQLTDLARIRQNSRQKY